MNNIESVAAFVICCNQCIAKMTCQGRKVFGGQIRKEVGNMAQAIFRAGAVTSAVQRKQVKRKAMVHFKTLCRLFGLCLQADYIKPERYAEFAQQASAIENLIAALASRERTGEIVLAGRRCG
jgi:hypothetical protein